MTDLVDYARLELAVETGADVGSAWRVIGHLFARDALVIGRALGIGEDVPYGTVAQSTINPLEFVVAIRGTRAPIECLEDLDAMFCYGPPVGQVHRGMWGIYASMWFVPLDGVRSTLSVWQAIAGLLPDGSDVCVVGHSLGSAIGTYLMADLARPSYKSQRTYTVGGHFFASPKPGDAAFGKDVNAVVGPFNYSVWNFLRDVVPRVPLSLPFGGGFQALSNVKIIKPSDAPVEVADNLACSHHMLTYLALVGGGFDPSYPCITNRSPT
jgi:hypothetical protein